MQVKKNLLWGAALIGLLVFAAAVTRTVSTEAEAQAILGRAASLQAGNCEPMGIEKIVQEQKDFANDWKVTYAMWYTRDGVLTREIGTVAVKNNNEAEVKAAVAPACEQAWAKAQAENQVIDTVIIQPTADQNPVLNQIYDVVERVWQSGAAQQIES